MINCSCFYSSYIKRLCCLLGIFLAMAISAAELTVGTGGTYDTIDNAFKVAIESDTIVLLPGQTHSVTGSMNWNKKVSLVGKDSTAVIQPASNIGILNTGSSILSDISFSNFSVDMSNVSSAVPFTIGAQANAVTFSDIYLNDVNTSGNLFVISGTLGTACGHNFYDVTVSGKKCASVVNINNGSEIAIDGLNVQDISGSLFNAVTVSAPKNITIRNATAKNIAAVTGALFSLSGTAQAAPNTVVIDGVTVDNVVSTFTTGNRGAILDLAGTNSTFTGMKIQNIEIKNNTKTQQSVCYISVASNADILVDSVKIDGVHAVNAAKTVWYNAFTFNSAKKLIFSNIDIQNSALASPVSSSAPATTFIDNVNVEKNSFSVAQMFNAMTVDAGGLRIKDNTMLSFTAPTGPLNGDILISGNILRNISGTGITCSSTSGAGNIIIRDNEILGSATSSALYGINCLAQTTGEIIIDSNMVDFSRATGSVRCAVQFKPTSTTVQLGKLTLSNNYCIGTFIYEPATVAKEVNISGNTVAATTGTAVTLVLGGSKAVTDTILISENVITANAGTGIVIYTSGAATTLNHTGTIAIHKNMVTAANNASTYGVTFVYGMGTMNINVTGNQFKNPGTTPVGTALNFYAPSVSFASKGDLYVHNNIFDMDGGLALQAHVSGGLMFRDVTVDSNFFSLHLKTAADFPLETATPNARNITVKNNTFDYSQVTANNIIALNIQRKLVPDPNGIGGEYIITGNRFINSSPSYSSSTGVVVLGGSNVFTAAAGGYDNVIFSENSFINPEVALRLISPITGKVLDATSNYWGDPDPDFSKVMAPLANMKTIPYYADPERQNKITTFKVTVNFNDGETPPMVLKYDINTDTTYSTLPAFLEKDYHYLKSYVYNPKTITDGVITGGTPVTHETEFLTTNDHTLYIDWAGKFAVVLGYKISGYNAAYINALTPDSKQSILIKIPATYDETSVLLKTRKMTEISNGTNSTGFTEPTRAGSMYGNKNHAGCKFINVDFSEATNLTALGYMSFASNEFQGDLVIPGNIKNYGSTSGAFQGLSCTGGLRLPEISADSINIPGQAFMGAKFGDSVLYIPSTIKTIDRRGFSFVGGIGKAVFAEGLEELYGSAFDIAFTDIPSRLILPTTLKRAGQDVFKGCKGLCGSTRLPYNLTTLGSQMFNECTNLRTIYLPDTTVFFGYSGGNMNAPHYVDANKEDQCLLIFANKARYDEPWLNFNGSTVSWNNKSRSYGLQTSYELPLQFRLIAKGNPAKDLDPRGHYMPDSQLKLFNKQYDYERNNDSSDIMYEAWLRNPASALPPVPEMPGYTRQYANWSVSTSGLPGINVHDASTRIMTDSAYLYAVYTPMSNIPYSVVHYTQNADKTYTLSDTVNLTGTSGETATVDLNTYPFYTWSATTYEDALDTATASVLPISGDGSLVVRIYYDRTPYTVFYDGNTATSGNTPTPKNYSWGTDVTVLDNPFSKTGYYFTAWNTQADGGGTAYSEKAVFTMPQDDVTLYAQWEPFLVVTFDSNGGTPVDSQTLRKGDLVIEPVPPTLQHYTFDGWFVDNTTFVTPWNFQADVVTKSMTLYAKWKRLEYNVTFHANHDTSIETYTQPMPCHTPTALIPVQFPQRLPDDKLFDGWNTQADGSGDSYADEALFEIEEANADLYAQWTPGYTVFAKELIAYQEGTSVSGEPFPRPYFELSIDGKKLSYKEMLALDYYIDGVEYDPASKMDLNGKSYADTFIYEIPFLADHYYDDQFMTQLDSVGFFEQHPVTQDYKVTVRTALGAFLPMYAVSGTLENRQVVEEGGTYYAGIQETPPAGPISAATPQVAPGTQLLNVAGWPAAAPVLLNDSVLSDESDTIHAEIAAKPDLRGLSYLLRYFDLVDSNNGNILLHTADSSSVTIHLPYPYPSKMNESTPFKILHFTDVNRSLVKRGDFTVTEALTVSRTPSGIKFDAKSFSPFALLYPSRWVIAADLPDTYYHGLNYSPDSVTVWDYYTDLKLVRDSDYILTWDNNLNAGTATLTVTGTGVYSTLFETYDYRILPVPLVITVASDTVNVGQAYQNITLDSATGIFAENIRYTIQPLGYTVSTPAGIYPDMLTASIDWVNSSALPQNYLLTVIPGTLNVLRLNAGIHLHVVQNHLFEAGEKLGLVTHTPEPMPVTYTSTNPSVVRVLPGEDAVEIVGVGNAWIVASTPRTARYEAAVDSQQVFIFAARQTLTFDPVPEKIFNDAPFALSAKSSSGLPVVFDSLNPSVASVDPVTGMVTIHAAGSAVLTVSQPGNDTYMAADAVVRTLTVRKADAADVIIADTQMIVGETLILPQTVQSSGAYLYYTAARPEIMISGNSIYSLAWNADSIRIDYRAAATDNFNALADSHFYLTVTGEAQSLPQLDSAMTAGYGTHIFLPETNEQGTALRYWVEPQNRDSERVTGYTLETSDMGTGAFTVHTQALSTNRYMETMVDTYTYVTVTPSLPVVIFPQIGIVKVGEPHALKAWTNDGSPVAFELAATDSAKITPEGILLFTDSALVQVTAHAAKNANGDTVDVRVTQLVRGAWSADEIIIPKVPVLMTGTRWFFPLTSVAGKVVTYQESSALGAVIDGNSIYFGNPGTYTFVASTQPDPLYPAVSTVFTAEVKRNQPFLTLQSVAPQTFTPSGAVVLNAFTNSDTDIVFSTKDSDKISISADGVVTFLSAGTVTVSAQVGATARYESASRSITFDIRKGIRQNLYFAPIADRVYAPNATVILETVPAATAYSASDSAVVDNLGNINGAGIVTLSAHWSADSCYDAQRLSQTFTVAKAPAVITVFADTVVTYGVAEIKMAAVTAPAGLGVAYRSMNPDVATVDSVGHVMIKRAGSAMMVATILESANYTSGASATAFLTVMKAPLPAWTVPDQNVDAGTMTTLADSVNGLPIVYGGAEEIVMFYGNRMLANRWNATAFTATATIHESTNYTGDQKTFSVKVNGLAQTVDTANLSGVVGQILYLANVNDVGTALRYTSADQSVMVAGNTLQLKKTGIAVVTVTAPATDRYQSASGTFTVTVAESPLGDAWINFPPVSGLKVGMRTLMYATSNVGLPITYTVHDPNAIAVRDGNVLYFTKPGELTVTASTNATGQYNAASASQVFLVQADRKKVRLTGDGIGDGGRIFEWDHQAHLLTVDTASFYISGDTDYYSLFYTAPSKTYYQNKAYAGACATYRNGQIVDSFGQLPTEPGTYDVVFVNHNGHYGPSIPHIPGILYYPYEVEDGMTVQMQIIPYTVRADSIIVAGLNASYDGSEKDVVLTFDSNIPQDSGICRNRSSQQTYFRDSDYTVYFMDPYYPGLRSVNPPRAAGVYNVVAEFHGTENSIAGHYSGTFHYTMKIESSNPFDYHIAVCLGTILNDRGEPVDRVVFTDNVTPVTVYAPVIVLDDVRVPQAGQSIGVKVSWSFAGSAMDLSTTQVLEKTAIFDGVSRRCLVPFTLKPPANMPGTHFTEFSLNQFGVLSENGTGLYAEDPKRQVLEVKIPPESGYIPPKGPSHKVTFTRIRNIAYGIQKVPVEVWSPSDNVTLTFKVNNPKGMSSTLESYSSNPLEKLDDTTYRWRLNKGSNALALNPRDPGSGFKGIKNFKIKMSDVRDNGGKVPTYRITTRVSLLSNPPYVGAVEASFESTLTINDRDRYIVPFADQLDTVILNGLLPKTSFETIDFVNAVRYPNLTPPQGHADELSLSLGDSGVTEVITEQGAKVKLMGGIYFVYTASDSLITAYGVKGWTDSFTCYVLQSGAGKSCVPVKVHIGPKWTRGMPFDINTQMFGIQSFEKKPKVWGEYKKTYDVVRQGREVKSLKLNGMPYIRPQADSDVLKYTFKSSVSMVNRKVLFKDRKTSFTLDLLAADTMMQRYQRNRVGVSLNGAHKHTDATGMMGSVVYVTPRVDSATYCYVGGFDGHSVGKIGLVLSGGYMGEKTKVFVEYRNASGKLKRSACRVLHGKERRDVKIVDPWTGSGGGSIMIPEKAAPGAEEYIVVLLPRIFDAKTREKLSPDGRFDVIIQNGMGYGGKRDIFPKPF